MLNRNINILDNEHGYKTSRNQMLFLVLSDLIIVSIVIALYFLMSKTEMRKTVVFLSGLILLPIAILKPMNGFYLFLMVLPLLKANLHLTDSFDLSAVDLFVLLYGILFLLRFSLGWRPSIYKDKVISYSIIIYLSALIIGSVHNYYSIEVSDHAVIIYYVKNFIVYYALFYLTMFLVKTEEDLEKCYAMIAFSAILVGLLSFLQMQTLGKSFDLFDVVSGSQDSRLATESYGHSNILAQQFVMTIPFLVYWVLSIKNYKIKTIGYIGSIICFIGLFLTFSRSAWLAAVFPIFIFAFLKKGTFVRFFIISGFMVFFLVLVTQWIFKVSFFDLIIQRFGELESSNMSERPEIWSNTLMLIKKSPFFGNGLGNFSYSYWLYTDSTYAREHAHNLFMTHTANTGLITLSMFIVILSRIFYLLANSLKKLEGSHIRYVYYALFSSYIGILMMFLVENLFYSPLNTYLFFVILGLILSFIRLNNERIQKTEESPSIPEISNSIE